MQPASTLLALFGYALAVPILFRVVDVVTKQQRVRLVGLQIGLMIAALGWLLRGRLAMAAVHLVLMIGFRLWFAAQARRPGAKPLSGA